MEGLDPTLLAHMVANPDIFPPPPTELAKDVHQVRAAFDAAIPRILSQYAHLDDKVDVTLRTFKSFDGAEVTIWDVKPKGRAEPAEPERAVVHYHGGGNVACSVEKASKRWLFALAVELDVRAFGVEFRYAPEHPYPTPVEDCYAALKWVQESGETLHVDPKRVCVIGESGGGNLAAGVALLARDRELSPPIAKAILLCPMLDDRASERHINTETSSRDKSLIGFRNSVDIAWDAYLSGKRGKPDVPAYAAPSRAGSLRGLQSTYIDIGSLDPFVQESLEFASRLIKEDVQVEMHVHAGMIHGFDFSAPGIPAVRSSMADRKRAIWSV